MIKIKLLNDKAITPSRGSVFAAGLDLYCTEEINIEAHQRQLVSTGIAVALPKDSYGRIAPRSKLAYQLGLDVMAGVIDNDYRGEVKVLLYNTSALPIKLPVGSKVAQLVVETIHYKFRVVDDLEQTLRGNSGVDDKDLRVIVPPDATHLDHEGMPHKFADKFWRVFVNNMWVIRSGEPYKLKEIQCGAQSKETVDTSEEHY